MAKNPVFPLYYNDITGSTLDWSDEEFGAYVRLLIHQWRQGSLPNDYQRLTRIATSLDINWHKLKVKFPVVDGVLKNSYLEEIRDKKAKHSEKQRDNVLNRYQKSTKILPLEKEKEIELEKEDWLIWGNQILNDEDWDWQQMKGRKINQDELDNFISVATRCGWSMKTQQDFRKTLKGFKSNNSKTNGLEKIINDKIQSDAIIKAKYASKASGTGAN